SSSPPTAPRPSACSSSRSPSQAAPPTSPASATATWWTPPTTHSKAGCGRRSALAAAATSTRGRSSRASRKGPRRPLWKPTPAVGRLPVALAGGVLLHGTAAGGVAVVDIATGGLLDLGATTTHSPPWSLAASGLAQGAGTVVAAVSGSGEAWFWTLRDGHLS